MPQHPSERLDRTAFTSGKHDQVAHEQRAARLAFTPIERLEASWVRTCRLNGIDPYNPPPFDRTAFSMRKLPG